MSVDKTAAALETANEAEMLDVRVYYELALVSLSAAELNLATCQYRIIKLRDKLDDHPTREEWRAANATMMRKQKQHTLTRVKTVTMHVPPLLLVLLAVLHPQVPRKKFALFFINQLTLPIRRECDNYVVCIDVYMLFQRASHPNVCYSPQYFHHHCAKFLMVYVNNQTP